MRDKLLCQKGEEGPRRRLRRREEGPKESEGVLEKAHLHPLNVKTQLCLRKSQQWGRAPESALLLKSDS